MKKIEEDAIMKFKCYYEGNDDFVDDMEELNFENYAANLLWIFMHPNQIQPRWLCTSEQYRRRIILILKKEFQNWQQEEFRAKKARDKEVISDGASIAAN